MDCLRRVLRMTDPCYLGADSATPRTTSTMHTIYPLPRISSGTTTYLYWCCIQVPES
ncbi:MAG: hypothetical protein JWO10_462 [Microbacteriaceae bacterium]|nr:hypothetical protein [Microbacteriaceae bacterium]